MGKRLLLASWILVMLAVAGLVIGSQFTPDSILRTTLIGLLCVGLPVTFAVFTSDELDATFKSGGPATRRPSRRTRNSNRRGGSGYEGGSHDSGDDFDYDID